MRNHRVIIFFKIPGQYKIVMCALFYGNNEQLKSLCIFSYNSLNKAEAARTQNIYFKHLRYIKLKFIQPILPRN